MNKLSKKNKVENYLKKLSEIEDFTVETLMDMTVFDMLGNSDLEGIGKTTLSEALDSFKQEFKPKKSVEEGLIPATHTKKERVTRYLTKLMKEPEFRVDDLMNLTVHDLFGNPELEGIGKTTLRGGIGTFKENYLKIQYSSESINEQSNLKTSNFDDSEDFNNEGNEITTDLEADKIENNEPLAPIEMEETEEESFENVGKNENEIVIKRKSTEEHDIGDTFSSDEIATLRMMFEQFKVGRLNNFSTLNLELIELKHALRYFGFDYKTLLVKYRKIVG
jgi:hypothetical protein